MTSRTRILARFLAIGISLYGAREGVSRYVLHRAPERRPLVVRVDPGASEERARAAIDESILVDMALRAGWARSDPIVRERILKSLEAVGDAGSDPSSAIERGLAMSIPSKDPVARSRLITAARRTIEDGAPSRTIGDDEIARYIEAHRDAFVVPARIRFDEVFVGRAHHADSLEADAATTEEALRSGADTTALGDPPPPGLPAPGTWIDTERLDALMGPNFGGMVAKQQQGAWSGPIRSSFGIHFVKILELEHERVSTVSEARARVVELLARNDRVAAFDARMVLLRELYAVSIERGR